MGSVNERQTPAKLAALTFMGPGGHVLHRPMKSDILNKYTCCTARICSCPKEAVEYGKRVRESRVIKRMQCGSP